MKTPVKLQLVFLTVLMGLSTGCVLNYSAKSVGPLLADVSFKSGTSVQSKVYGNSLNPKVTGFAQKSVIAISLYDGLGCQNQVLSTLSYLPNNAAFEINAGPLLAEGVFLRSVQASGENGELECFDLPEFVYDLTPPTVTIERDPGQDEYTTVVPIRYVFQFNEPIDPASFKASSIQQKGNATGLEWTISQGSSPNSYKVVVTGVATYGTIKPDVIIGAVTDLAGNAVATSSTINNKVVYGLAVEPAYENVGEDWNDHVRFDGADIHSATGVACDGTEATYKQCFHAGEIRKVVVITAANCAGLSMVDNLGIFQWVCKVVSGKTTFFSKGLPRTKGLRDLLSIDGLQWKNNFVTLSGGVSGTSVALNWWPNNPVVALPDNSLVTDNVLALSSAKTIYTLASSRATSGLSITADKISLVTTNSAVLSYSGATAFNCNTTDGSTTAANSRCVVAAGASKFLWIEADINSAASTNAGISLLFAGSKAPQVKLVKITQAQLRLFGVQAARIYGAQFLYADLKLVSSSGNFLDTITLAKGFIPFDASNNNVATNIAVNSTYAGVDFSNGASDNSVISVVSNANQFGIQINSATSLRNILAFATVTNTSNDPIGFWNGVRTTLHSLALLNGHNHGINATSGSKETSYSNIASLHNRFAGMALSSSSYNKFTGPYLAGGNGTVSCTVTGGTAPGINNACVGTQISTGLTSLVSGANAANSFLGKVSSDDAVNLSDTNGTATFPGVPLSFDWRGFSLPTGSNWFLNIFRSWGRTNANPFPDTGHRGPWNSGNGQIWDLTLRSTDTVLRNTSDTGTGSNVAIVNGNTCPAWLHGNDVVTDLSQGEVLGDSVGNDNGFCETGENCSGRTFLRNAVEVIDDYKGNDNGLCESSEACIAAPNYGAYQGQGDYTANTCTFQDGVVTGVQMYFWPTNGQ